MYRFGLIGLACTFAASLAIAGCARHQSASSELSSNLAPFTHTRNQAIALVTSGKHAFDAPSINRLAVAYTDLEEKNNAYAGFLVESASVGSFDAGKNAVYAGKLARAIDAFNASYASLQAISIVPLKNVTRAKLADGWVEPFAQTAQANWQRYHGALAASPQTVAAVTQQIKSQTVYPNFEDIATEPIQTRH
jgi:hypothetical protein